MCFFKKHKSIWNGLYTGNGIKNKAKSLGVYLNNRSFKIFKLLK